MEKLTSTEHRALRASFNLGDAHVHMKPNLEREREIIQQLPNIFWEAYGLSQADVDFRGVRGFMALSGQSTRECEEWYLPVYASSVSIEIVADHLSRSGITVGLIEPTFDNIPDILKRRGVPLQAISVAAPGDYARSVLAAIRTLPGQAVFIVSPNNPTGEYLDADEFTEIALTCTALQCLLILDSSFRLFEPSAMFDQHGILAAAGTDYVIIEDTGKYWPSLDLKLSYIFASPALRATLQSIHEDILLNVSPFISLLVSRFAEMSAADGLQSVREPIAANRRALRDMLTTQLGSCTTPFADSRVSVEFVRLPDDWRADHFARHLEINGLVVLPGNRFFWNESMRGDAYVRIALARSPADFGAALRALAGAVHGMPRRAI